MATKAFLHYVVARGRQTGFAMIPVRCSSDFEAASTVARMLLGTHGYSGLNISSKASHRPTCWETEHDYDDDPCLTLWVFNRQCGELYKASKVAEYVAQLARNEGE